MAFHSSKWPPLRKKNNLKNYVILLSTYFLFGIIVAVKSISGIKGGYAMWFSPVNCPRGCSSVRCDMHNDTTHAGATPRTIYWTKPHGITTLEQLTTPRWPNVSLVLLILFLSTKHPLTIQYIFKGRGSLVKRVLYYRGC